VNLATGSLTVRESKTDAGQGRVIDLPLGLVEELAEWRARSPRTGPNDPVFTSEPRNGRAARQTKRNVEARLKAAIKTANARLAELDIEPISERVTPHSLRRAYASLRFALGDDPVYVAGQLGHTKPAFSMEVYASAVKRRDRLSGTYREEFDRALEWARMGSTESASQVLNGHKGTETGTETDLGFPAQKTGALESALELDSGA
jgi:integrase